MITIDGFEIAHMEDIPAQEVADRITKRTLRERGDGGPEIELYELQAGAPPVRDPHLVDSVHCVLSGVFYDGQDEFPDGHSEGTVIFGRAGSHHHPQNPGEKPCRLLVINL
ncbi:hypothetical protein [Streptomyces sp. 7N604]|uniref:hypothetical protein n=1 Tax=Streptomyces sp. 7N604 TaxID=3457415 RepID=UPI003FCFD6C2